MGNNVGVGLFTVTVTVTNVVVVTITGVGVGGMIAVGNATNPVKICGVGRTETEPRFRDELHATSIPLNNSHRPHRIFLDIPSPSTLIGESDTFGLEIRAAFRAIVQMQTQFGK